MLTESKVASSLANGKRQFIKDNSGITGFGLTISAKGKKKFALDYRLNGKRTTTEIGSWPAMDLSQARLIACNWRERIDQGLPPLEQTVGITFESVAEEYRRCHLPSLKLTTRTEYSRHIDILIKEFAGLNINQITLPVVRDLHRGRDGHIQANRIIGTLSSLIGFATDAGYRLDANEMPLPNPCLAIKKHREQSRVDITIGKAKMMQILDYLREHESHDAYAYYMTLIITAARAGEVDGMKWSDIRDGVWFKSDTKKGKVHKVKLHSLLSVLQGLPMRADGKIHSFTNHRGVWDRVRKNCGVSITRHDLRGSVATELINSGMPIEEISQMLGHSDISITRARYAHLISDSSNAVKAVEAMIS